MRTYSMDQSTAPTFCEKCGAQLAERYYDYRTRHDPQSGDRVTLARLERKCPNGKWGHTAWTFGEALYAGYAAYEIEVARMGRDGEHKPVRNRVSYQ